MVAAPALFAAHLAFIAAANCARRSGVRLSFLFSFAGTCGLLTAPAGFVAAFIAERCGVFCTLSEVFATPPAFLAGAADPALVLATRAVDAASSFRFSLASFFAPFCRRASSRRIFFLRLLNLAISNEESGIGANHEVLRMSRLIPDRVRQWIAKPTVDTGRHAGHSGSKHQEHKNPEQHQMDTAL